MKIAVVYNRDSKSVINVFGMPNQEKIGLKTIRRITDALKAGGHQVTSFEGDKDLIDRLEEFMPRVVKGERPGMVFNVSYGIQGQARYTHVPSILEMVGIPYVASGPLAHSLALDKVVTKMILRQHDLPTPDFTVLDAPGFSSPDFPYPAIVKPKSEAVSFGIRVVQNEEELREAAQVIFDRFSQPVLAEQFIEGREINVGLLGNNPPEILPPVELVFGGEGPKIYTYEDKMGRSKRKISHVCPAPVGEDLLARAKEISRKAFDALGCCDCARVDLRLDGKGSLYILEVNSLPSMGEHGSYTIAAEHAGLDYPGLVNRLVEVASARYFGTPHPPGLERKTLDRPTRIFSYITERRDRMEPRVREWTELSSHTDDTIGVRAVRERLSELMESINLRPVADCTDERSTWTWETMKGMAEGTLLVGHLDVPGEVHVSGPRFRKEPEWLYGDGIGSSRAPLVMLEFALRAIRSTRRLRRFPLGILYYTDEGWDGRYSAELIRKAASQAKRVLILRPGNPGGYLITQRRGQRIYRFQVEGEPHRPGRARSRLDPLRWTWTQLEEMSRLTKAKERVSVSALNLSVDRLPMLLPHRVTARLLVTFPDTKTADRIEGEIRSALPKRSYSWNLELISDRPAMMESKKNLALARSLERVAEKWEIPLKHQSSVWPSVAGLVPKKVACLCGVGPAARDLGTSHESVLRISLVQRTLALAQFLSETLSP
jgi:D-alanine-D-alanine ligase